MPRPVRDHLLNPIISKLIHALESAQLELGWNQHQLAERAGLSQSMVSDTFAGRTVPSLRTVAKLVDAMNLEIHLRTKQVLETAKPY